MTPWRATMSRHDDDHRPREEDLRLEQIRREAEAKALAERLQKTAERPRE
jgi:hypothetical protein